MPKHLTEALDREIEHLVRSGQSKKRTAEIVGVTPSAVSLALERIARRSRAAASPYLSDKLDVRTQGAILMARVDPKDNEEVYRFVMDEKRALAMPGLGRKSWIDSRNIALAWEQEQPLALREALAEKGTSKALEVRVETLEAEIADLRKQVEALVDMLVGRED